MNDVAEKLDQPDTAEIILAAAVKRFSEYGYNKTTMAEIANDTGMSAANIYRYYKSKQEIAETCTKNRINEKTNTLKIIVRDTQLSATEKLEKYVQTTLKLSQEAALENRKIDEVCAEIIKSKAEFIYEKINHTEALIIEILSYGNQTGEFDVDDVVDTAIAINTMIVAFDVPMFMSLFTPEEFNNKADSVTKLILQGIAKA